MRIGAGGSTDYGGTADDTDTTTDGGGVSTGPDLIGDQVDDIVDEVDTGGSSDSDPGGGGGGGSDTTDTTTDDDAVDYTDPSATTGLGGSMGDSPTEDRNQTGDYDVDADPSDTTGLGGSMGDDPVTDENQAEHDTPEDTGSTGLLGSVWDAYTRALGGGLVNSTTGNSALTDEDGDFYDGDTVEDPNVYDQTEDGTEEAGNEAADAAEDAADVVDDAADDAAEVLTPEWVDWILNHQEEALIALVVLVALFLAKPYAEAGSAVAGGS